MVDLSLLIINYGGWFICFGIFKEIPNIDGKSTIFQ